MVPAMQAAERRILNSYPSLETSVTYSESFCWSAMAVVGGGSCRGEVSMYVRGHKRTDPRCGVVL